MATPFWDVDAAVEEVERCVEAGHRGILFTGEPHRFGLAASRRVALGPAVGDRAQDAGLPIHFHIGSGDTATSCTPERIAAHGTASTYAYTSVEMFLKNGMQVADLLTSGVLPRFPDLKFVSVESGIGWIPFVLEAVDHSYLEARTGHTSQWEKMPSEYFDQVYSCYWFETAATTTMLEALPVERILFETDFPHPTCLYGNVRERIDASLVDGSRRRAPGDPVGQRRRPVPHRGARRRGTRRRARRWMIRPKAATRPCGAEGALHGRLLRLNRDSCVGLGVAVLVAVHVDRHVMQGPREGKRWLVALGHRDPGVVADAE